MTWLAIGALFTASVFLIMELPTAWFGARAWAWRKRTQHVEVWSASLPRRERWKLYLAVALTHPAMLWHYAHGWFLLLCPLPGDEWYDPQRDLHGEVVRCLPHGVVVDVRSSRVVDAMARGRLVLTAWQPIYETVESDSLSRWLP